MKCFRTKCFHFLAVFLIIKLWRLVRSGKQTKSLLMESNFRTAWNLVDLTYIFPKVYPKYPQLHNPLLNYSSAGLAGIPLHLTPAGVPSTGWNFLPTLEKLAVSTADSLLCKVPEWNWSKSQLGGTCAHLQVLMLTFHDGDVNSSSPGPGHAAQPWTMGYGGTATAGNHPSSEVKEKEHLLTQCTDGCGQDSRGADTRIAWQYFF